MNLPLSESCEEDCGLVNAIVNSSEHCCDLITLYPREGIEEIISLFLTLTEAFTQLAHLSCRYHIRLLREYSLITFLFDHLASYKTSVFTPQKYVDVRLRKDLQALVQMRYFEPSWIKPLISDDE